MKNRCFYFCLLAMALMAAVSWRPVFAAEEEEIVLPRNSGDPLVDGAIRATRETVLTDGARLVWNISYNRHETGGVFVEERPVSSLTGMERDLCTRKTYQAAADGSFQLVEVREEQDLGEDIAFVDDFGAMVVVIRYEYDASGRQAAVTQSFFLEGAAAEEAQESDVAYEFDDKGRVVLESHRVQGTVDCEVLHEYAEEGGFEIETVRYPRNSTMVTKTKRNEAGDPVEIACSTTNGDTVMRESKVVLEYTNHGQLASKLTDVSGAQGAWTEKESREYDMEGRLVKLALVRSHPDGAQLTETVEAYFYE